MKKQIAMMAMALAPMLGMAQDEDAPRQQPHHDPAAMTERMAEKLQLSPEQTEKVQELNMEMQRRMEELRAQMEKLREQHMENLKSVLNEEQQARLEEMKARHHDRMKSHWEKRREKRGPDHKTDDQD